MNKVFGRNNIYFMYEKDKPEYRYIAILAYPYFFEYSSLSEIGTMNDLFDNDNIVIAPIDLLLFHIPHAEYLHRDYTKEEQTSLLNGSNSPNIYRKLKYIYSLEELLELDNFLTTINTNEILSIICKYDNYLKNRKKDSILRIYTR